MEMEIKNKNKGFTLVEVLIAIFAFGIIVIAMSGVAQSVIKSQRKAFVLQDIQESGRYILESLSKEIRMSVVEPSDPSGSDYVVSQSDTLNITNSKGEDVVYEFAGDPDYNLWRQIDGGVWEDLSPSNLKTTGSFYIRKRPAPAVRALVTINMKIESEGPRVEQESEVYLQGTISSRSWEY